MIIGKHCHLPVHCSSRTGCPYLTMSTKIEDWMVRKQLCNIVLVYSPQMLLGDQQQTTTRLGAVPSCHSCMLTPLHWCAQDHRDWHAAGLLRRSSYQDPGLHKQGHARPQHLHTCARLGMDPGDGGWSPVAHHCSRLCMWALLHRTVHLMHLPK